MKHLLHIALLLVMFVGFANAQPHMERRFERIHAIKVAYITDKMHLSADQSARFWPVYNRFDDEKREMRRNFFKKYKNSDNTSSAEGAMRYIDDDLDYQEQELALRRRYKEKLLKVLSPEQLAELYKAEREFKEMLLQQLKGKRGMGRDN